MVAERRPAPHRVDLAVGLVQGIFDIRMACCYAGPGRCSVNVVAPGFTFFRSLCPMADPDPNIVTTCGILLCCVTGAIGRAELTGWPDYEDDGEEC